MGFLAQAILLTSVSLSWYFRRDEAEAGSDDRGVLAPSLLLRGLVTLAIVATLIVGAFWMGGQSLALKFEGNAIASDVDGVTRREIWHSTWSVFKDHLVTGVGFGAYFLAITDRQIGSGKVRIEQAHNDYLDLAANGGIIAVLLAAWFVLMVIWRAKSSLRSRDFYRRAVALGALAGILSVGVHSIVDFGLQVTGLALVFGALIVIAIADVEPKARYRKRAVPADQHMDSSYSQPVSAYNR
jgi:O-antigen ligase